MPSTSPFLRLPVELRYAIYDHLCPREPHSYPYKQPSPIAAIDIAGPPKSLLLLNHALLEELSTYYFARCTFRFVAQSFSTGKNVRKHMCAGSLQIVRKMKKVEMLLLPGTMKAMSYSAEVSLTTRGMSKLWLVDQMRLLRDEAWALTTITVSVRRVSWCHEWSMLDETEALLHPLKELKGRVAFKAGEVMGPATVEDEMRETLETVIGKLSS
ncbi:hypothetical protein C7974DRAFT_57546 [Boeremia exigua]|uniref:uncharacterized protein n=1 Tax=Boeremia exigua TaxID=749465 RepID=UPI001E8D884D|nr:uncharacterized protein C7974DRAFT_57546 [Boeremia exigua]KAH6615026.1 hypothetical protein C7974DRAFT_57546 [Boeremia exigua]